MTPKETPVSLEIKSKIYVIRGQKVMLDRDLAELYGVETRTLNQKVQKELRKHVRMTDVPSIKKLTLALKACHFPYGKI